MEFSLIQRTGTGDEFVNTAVRAIIGIIDSSLGERGDCFTALAGGTTPAPVYRSLGHVSAKRHIDWSRIHLFFTDERMVPPDDPESNYGMVRRELISGIPIPAGNVHRIEGESTPEAAAEKYAAGLIKYGFDHRRRFDLIVLGVGADGHVASIFPENEDRLAAHPMVQAVTAPPQKGQRVSITMPVINRAREIVVLVTGKEKAGIIRKVFSKSHSGAKLPVLRVIPADGRIRWIVDADAAGMPDRKY